MYKDIITMVLITSSWKQPNYSTIENKQALHTSTWRNTMELSKWVLKKL